MNKLLVLLAAALAVASAAQNPFEPLLDILKDHEVLPKAVITANINDYIDKTLDNLKRYIPGSSFDPMEVPDMLEGFSVKPLFIEYHGELELTEGKVYDLDTVYRYGPANLSYDKKIVRARFEIGFQDLLIEFEYLAKIMNIGPTGQLVGRVDRVTILIDIVIDLEDFTFYLQEFDVPYIGAIDIKLKGNIFTDWLVNGITKAVTFIFKNMIKNVIGGRIEGMITDAFNEINSRPRFIM